METLEDTEERTVMRSNRGDIYEFTCEFPEKNPPDALKNIVDCFESIGMFDGISEQNKYSRSE